MFDLSMQSALDIFCYVLVLIYGLALSADLSTGGHVSRQQKYLLTLLCLLFLLMLALGLVLLGERTVKQLYPLVIHVPLVLILILFMKKSVGVAIVSTCTAYLCCQPPRWGRIAVEALTQSTLAAELVYILLMPVMYYLLRRFFVAAAYNTMTSSTAALLLFAYLFFRRRLPSACRMAILPVFLGGFFTAYFIYTGPQLVRYSAIAMLPLTLLLAYGFRACGEKRAALAAAVGPN